MIPKRLKVFPGQTTKIRRAIRRHKGCIVSVCNSDEPGSEGGTFLLNAKQVSKLDKSPSGHPVKIMLTADQVKKNMEHTGGFLPIIAALLAPVIGSAVGAAVDKAISGKGLSPGTTLWAKKSGTYEIHPHGLGLRLTPYKGEKLSGYGLYLNPHNRKGGAVKVNPQELKEFSPMAKSILTSIL